MAHLPADHCGPGVPLGPGLGDRGTRPLTANFRRTREFALESCSSVKAPRLGGSVEWGERWTGWQLLLRRLPTAAKS